MTRKGFSLKLIIITITAILFLSGIAYYIYIDKRNSNSSGLPTITNFEECVAEGNPVMESYPERCIANGQTFTKSTDNPGNYVE